MKQSMQFWLVPSSLPKKSLDCKHVGAATRAFIDLYPDEAPTYAGKYTNGLEGIIRASGHPNGGYCGNFPRTRFKIIRGEGLKDRTTSMHADTTFGNMMGIDSHEVTCHPQYGTLHYRGCVVLAFARIVRTAPWILIDQGVAFFDAMLDIIGPLGDYVTRFEVSLRETSHDFKHANHDFSRCSFTYHKLPALSGRVFRVFEITASTITGISTIDHRTQEQ